MKTKSNIKVDKIEIDDTRPHNTITGCNFVGVQWDKSTLETINLVAKGLVNLTELFKSQNVEIETLLKITNDKKNKEI